MAGETRQSLCSVTEPLSAGREDTCHGNMPSSYFAECSFEFNTEFLSVPSVFRTVCRESFLCRVFSRGTRYKCYIAGGLFVCRLFFVYSRYKCIIAEWPVLWHSVNKGYVGSILFSSSDSSKISRQHWTAIYLRPGHEKTRRFLKRKSHMDLYVQIGRASCRERVYVLV